MLFVPPNEQCPITEGKTLKYLCKQNEYIVLITYYHNLGFVVRNKRIGFNLINQNKTYEQHSNLF